MQPGQTISPGGETQEEQTISQQPYEVQNVPIPAVPEATAVSEPAPESTQAPISTDYEDLSWTASEFMEHQKPHGWYLTVTLAGLALAGVLYFIVEDIITVLVVAVAAILFAIVGARKPGATSYSLSHAGLRVGSRVYPYATFKSFSVIEEGAIDSIQFAPLKRFMQPVTIYFPPEQEDQIIDLLADYLPHEDRQHDPIDRLMKRLHF